MAFALNKNSRLRKSMGDAGASFLSYGLGGLTRILPHVRTGEWEVEELEPTSGAKTVANFANAKRRQLRLDLVLRVDGKCWKITGQLERLKAPSGVGSISRTISLRERDIAARVLTALSRTLGPASPETTSSLLALRPSFDERVVAAHLVDHHHLDIELGEWLASMRQLSEQTYENKALAFGCIIETKTKTRPTQGTQFPLDFLTRKRYRALSDAYRTAYVVSARGALMGFRELRMSPTSGNHFFPEWCEDLAAHSTSGKIGLALTRHGDILILDDGHLTFTYRFGRWQYWNHTHIVDLIRNSARVQNVPPSLVSHVVRSVYRAALDVSFRRSGGLFVLLRASKHLHQIVRHGEAVDDVGRESLDAAFDRAVTPVKVHSLPRAVLAELAGLDGAVVFSNNGDLLAYGAILEPKKKGRVTGTEGSRSKAAIGASNYGLAIKISSDGDLSVYVAGKRILTV
ncbi:MAG: hypothetical protein AB7T31_06285 [Gemmatimonadales bacterium]